MRLKSRSPKDPKLALEVTCLWFDHRAAKLVTPRERTAITPDRTISRTIPFQVAVALTLELAGLIR